MKGITAFVAGLAGATSAAAAIDLDQPQTFQTAEWTTTVTIDAIEAPGMPEEARQGLRSVLEAVAGRRCQGGRSTDIAREFRDALTQGFTGTSGGTCAFGQDDTFDRGVIRSRVVCRKPGNPYEMSADITGSYDARSLSIAFEMRATLAGDRVEPPALRVHASIVSRAGGPCRAQS